MWRFPVKKIRKQFKLLLVLVLLTFGIWFTYLHVAVLKSGRALKLHIAYGRDAEKLSEATDTGRKAGSIHAASNKRKIDDSSDSQEDEQMLDTPNKYGGPLQGEPDDYQRGSRQPLNLTQMCLLWKPEYKGKVNLHVFEDWCGSSIYQLRKNIHFPLYPHTRTSVNKIAVSPKWKNYGLRIFGYIHPYKDGDFQFAIASDDNSEFWLSSDESPANARLLMHVGKLGTEWAAPGEFTKFRSQVSNPVHVISARRYYFEVLHKQDDKGSDHVEVGWRPFFPGVKFEIISSPHISLYTDESSRKMNSVDHIPQTRASHAGGNKIVRRELHAADMLKPDPRDTFFLTPPIDPSRVQHVLPPCAYSPTYIVKDFPIARYQGLQFVYLSYVYPNDFTRLTHMETENKCFYRESPLYLEKFGFYKYMKMDEEEDKPFMFDNPEDFPEESEGIDTESILSDSQVTWSKSNVKDRENGSLAQDQVTAERKLLPLAAENRNGLDDDAFGHKKRSTSREHHTVQLQKKAFNPIPQGDNVPPSAAAYDSQETGIFHKLSSRRSRSLTWAKFTPEELSKKPANQSALSKLGKGSVLNLQPQISIPFVPSKTKQFLSNSAHAGLHKKRFGEPKKLQNKIYVTRPQEKKKRTLQAEKTKELFPGMNVLPSTKIVGLPDTATERKMVSMSRGRKTTPYLRNKIFWFNSNTSQEEREVPDTNNGALRSSATQKRNWKALQENLEQPQGDRNRDSVVATPEIHLLSEEILGKEEATLHDEGKDPKSTGVAVGDGAEETPYWKPDDLSEPQQTYTDQFEMTDDGMSDYSYEDPEPQRGWTEETINWQRTFSVSAMDFELLRSDWNDLRCNVSGNLQLSESEVVDVLAQYMEKLNEKNGGVYTLLRIVNVEKRRDSARGNRYLIELELMEKGRKVVRLTDYIYLLLHRTKQDDGIEATAQLQDKEPTQLNVPYHKPLLCQPVGLHVRPDVMVHFVVPVKNQARWVQQFIMDMEDLYHATRDESFNIIIIDFDSSDMDVEQTLKNSKLPRYQFLKRIGSFERSAGLQAGADAIEDSHTILFLCDLHIHFPISIIDNIRKHCIEGKLAYAPIVMRLGCGSSPVEPDGYWEVNGFGLFGIFKSDFDKIGGMNTEEFRDRWGGEDWELLDRVLQSGLEVERLRLRNFYHYFHSKRGMWDSQAKKTTKELNEG
ncbi:N-acetyl-beta-glucosaminyl-glycoprotein 4-beta-N-acetylgalactosaminyltransferase 1 isoform X2 [Hemiscyllium ocellatum]|uniref:N-acetyl-beta-glucosaminyl-glycoprotein 4-beta-N-acetylgalactosaminyltransferase 1 isoform X2 n=1 Tax=Hemiscyllium ocellatum TaxID=170820 RepID=UPI0029660FCC|nr:N-acetyl-beta-glucosaminyl-glycoprotein 4-beta-N-acetylgalactosaminyltransferase 1 isoform X2 [Hemiscyllium ocellatum]